MSGSNDIIPAPSPNFGERRLGAVPDLIVLHYTAMNSASAALDRLCDPKTEVSAHYLIGQDGTVWQMVDEAARAWHAGAGQWRDIADVNSRSIGIELANSGDHPFPEPQMSALEILMQGIMARWAIRPDAVIAHSDMAPGRKCDPGPRFDWRRLARQGLAYWPSDAAHHPTDPADPTRFKANLRAFGYPDVTGDLLLEAMRLRFRPWAHGALTPQDTCLAASLAKG